MLRTVKATNLIVKRSSILCGLLCAAALALLPASAGAQCTGWDASGEWSIEQRGLDSMIYMTLEQKGKVLTGTANTFFPVPKKFLGLGGGGGRPVKGTVEGTIVGDSFSVQIFWPDNLTGVYNGNVLPSGRLEGETFDKNHTEIRSTWHSHGEFKCAPPINPRIVVQSARPRPKPIKRSGKMPKSEPAPPKLNPPDIIASQIVFPFPGAPSGFAVLTWDGGTDHPYAEVWVKVNDGDEAFVVEQGSGTRQVIVERGKLYLYILTDSGKSLSTVSFSAPW